MAELFDDVSSGIDLVCSPALGAIVFGFSTALAMDRPFAFLNRDKTGKMILRSGFAVPSGTRVLVVEDVVTTGGSVRETVAALRERGAEVAQIGLLVDRTGGTAEFDGVPYRSLLTVSVESWEEGDCPLCEEGVPVVAPGSTGKT
jgi:orotate phosphoribosyltransferase